MTQYVILGLVVGAIYAIAAVGMVTTYSTSGVLDFSFGAFAYFIARVYYQLAVVHSLPVLAAALISIFVVAPVGGFILWALVFRQLAGAAPLTKVVATIGLLVAIPEATQMAFGIQITQSPIGLVAPTVHRIFGTPITSAQLLVFVVVIAITVIGAVVLRLSTAGLIARAVVSSESLSRLDGVNPQRVSLAAWIIGSILAGLAGIMIAPLVGLTPDSFTVLIASAFTAVAIARFRHLGRALLVGLLLGVLQSLAIDQFSGSGSQFAQGINVSIPFIILAVFLLFTKSGKTLDGESTTRQLAERFAADMKRRRVTLRLRSVRVPPLSLAGAIVLAALPVLLNTFWSQLVGLSMAMAIIFLSYVVVTGEGAMISLCQVSFAAIGGLGTAQLATIYHVPVLLALLVASVAAIPAGMLISILAIRLGHLYLALGTLAFAFAMEQLVFPVQRFYNYGFGVSVAQPAFLHSSIQFTYFAMALFGLACLALTMIRRSTLGLNLAAVRCSQPAAVSSGLNVTWYKVLSFSIGAFLAALGGGLVVLYLGAAETLNFATLTGLFWLVVIVTLGVRTNSSAALGGLAAVMLPAFWSEHFGVSVADVPTVLFGLSAIGVASEPRGAVVQMRNNLRYLTRLMRGRRDDRSPPPAPAAVSTATEVSAKTQ